MWSAAERCQSRSVAQSGLLFVWFVADRDLLRSAVSTGHQSD